jgi:predicted HAD superfamily phosphohydrolase
MSMEYNHMDELGFSQDKQLLCTASGFLSSGNSVKRMCDRFIRNGGRLYDIMTAYDSILSFGLDRDDRRSGDTFKTLVPFLKAAGVTDSSVYEYFKADMSLMPGSDSIHYLNGLMTAQIVSEAYEHHSMALCDALGLPSDSIRCTEVSFDALEMNRQDAKRFREFSSDISKMDIPKVSSNDGTQFIDSKDQMILETVDDILDAMCDTEFIHRLEEIKPIGGNEKAFTLMEMRRTTNVDFDCTAYIGNNGTDYPAMDIIRDNGGLAVSFNGDAYAVRGSNVAVMSPNSLVAAVIISEFYIGGMAAVDSLIDSWDRAKLSKREHSDRHLMNALFAAFPSRLPEVVAVDDDNLDKVTKESERYRRKLTV